MSFVEVVLIPSIIWLAFVGVVLVVVYKVTKYFQEKEHDKYGK